MGKIMRKSSVLLLMLGMSTAPLFAESVSTSEIDALKKQIEVLQKQLEAISKQVNEQGKQVKEIKTESKHAKAPVPAAAMPAPAAVVKEESQKEDTPVFEKGYIPVPGTKAAVKLEGLVKLDAIYDGKNNTGDFTLMSNLPYNLQSRAPLAPSQTNRYSWKKHFNMHAKQTRLGLRGLVKNNSGDDIKTHIEFDLYGTISLGDSAPTYGGSTASMTYTPRLRFATIAYGGLMAGHTWTNFFDFTETVTPTVDFGTHNGPIRQAQVRYTHKIDRFELAVSAEQPRADYVTYDNTPVTVNTVNYAYVARNAAGNIAKPQRPDMTLSLKYKADNGNVLGIGMVSRDLTIKNNNASAVSDGRTYRANGYGFNIAAKVMTMGKSFVTGGVTFGRGIGWYIGDLTGRSAFFDISNTANGSRTYKTIPMRMAWLGYTHVWNAQWQTTMGGSQADLSTRSSTFNRGTNRWFDPGLDRQMRRLHLNTVYKPEENLEFGLEFMYLKRRSVLKYTGQGNRYQLGASYKF
jgi:hypothetical protein